jgi:hypothetical protein
VVSSSQKTNSTTTTPAPPVVDPTYIWTGVLILLGGFLCIIQLFASIFGRRMHLQTIRWHTVGYNCWNIVFLVIIKFINLFF